MMGEEVLAKIKEREPSQLCWLFWEYDSGVMLVTQPLVCSEPGSNKTHTSLVQRKVYREVYE